VAKEINGSEYGALLYWKENTDKHELAWTVL
jgi:hypothetical protein